MEPVKQLNVLGIEVDILTPSAATANAFMISAYTCDPQVGPPPHWHQHEDEIFSVLEGEFEIFNGASWAPIPKGDYVHALRGSVHTFRNSGTGPAKLLCIATPGGLDHYFEEIAGAVMPQDADRVLAVSKNYGISFGPPAA